MLREKCKIDEEQAHQRHAEFQRRGLGNSQLKLLVVPQIRSDADQQAGQNRQGKFEVTFENKWCQQTNRQTAGRSTG